MDDGVDASKFGWIEIALFYGVVLFFAFRELWLLRRHRKTQEKSLPKDAKPSPDKPDAPP